MEGLTHCLSVCGSNNDVQDGHMDMKKGQEDMRQGKEGKQVSQSES